MLQIMGPSSAVSEFGGSVAGSGGSSEWGREYEDEDTWYEFSSSYQAGDGTQLIPSIDTGLTARLAQYRRSTGTKGGAPRQRPGRRERRDVRDMERIEEDSIDVGAAAMPSRSKRKVWQLKSLADAIGLEQGFKMADPVDMDVTNNNDKMVTDSVTDVQSSKRRDKTLTRQFSLRRISSSDVDATNIDTTNIEVAKCNELPINSSSKAGDDNMDEVQLRAFNIEMADKAEKEIIAEGNEQSQNVGKKRENDDTAVLSKTVNEGVTEVTMTKDTTSDVTKVVNNDMENKVETVQSKVVGDQGDTPKAFDSVESHSTKKSTGGAAINDTSPNATKSDGTKVNQSNTTDNADVGAKDSTGKDVEKLKEKPKLERTSSAPVVIKRRIVRQNSSHKKVTFKSAFAKVKEENKKKEQTDVKDTKEQEDSVTMETTETEAKSEDSAATNAKSWQEIGSRTFINVAAVVANLMQTNYFKSQRKENERKSLRRSNSGRSFWRSGKSFSLREDPLEFLIPNGSPDHPEGLMAKDETKLIYVTNILLAFPFGIFLGVIFSIIFNILT